MFSKGDQSWTFWVLEEGGVCLFLTNDGSVQSIFYVLEKKRKEKEKELFHFVL